MSKKVKKKVIFIMPPKEWFYGIDYIESERIVKYFKDNEIFDIYKFEDINLFLKDKLKIKDFLKAFYIYFFFKIKKPEYVFAYNASYIVYCNFVFKKKIINFFSQILNLKCILRWDHMNEQIPNIVERIIKRSKFNDINDYKNFFLNKINHKNFFHYTWQNDEYFCKKNYIENLLELEDFKLKKLSFLFTHKTLKDNDSFKKVNKDKTIALIGYINKIPKTDINIDEILPTLNNKKNFFSKQYYKTLIDYSNYEYSNKKNELLKIENLKFHGINLIENSGKIINANDFYSNISKFFLIINPVNPISITITSKFYLIYLHGGFCINELPCIIPGKLEKYKNFIFYKDQKELIEKVEYLKNNPSVYLSIKKEIYEISNDLKIDRFKSFYDEFIKKNDLD